NSTHITQPVICATLSGSSCCEAAGITARGHAPILALCRKLLAAGFNPDSALIVYRNGVLSIRINSIGKAASLVVEDSKNGRPRFRPARSARGGAVSRMRKNGLRGTDHRPTARERLPNRRASETFNFNVKGLHYWATISRFADDRIGEIFLNNHKAGSQVDTA